MAAEFIHFEGQFPDFETCYCGGGTPSAIDLSDLASLIMAIKGNLDFTLVREATIELNPDDVSIDLLKSLLELGFNRVSLGIQSLSDRELRFLGRRHNAVTGFRAMAMARQIGVPILSVDLMYGFCGQTAAAWKQTLTKVLSYNPEHISCYQVTVAAETPFGCRAKAGERLTLTERGQSRLFLWTSEFLAANGYEHYEVSNYAREGYQCKHNLKYWNHEPYLGLGPAAHSFLSGKRWWNPKSVRDYLQRLAVRKDAVEDHELLTDEQLAMEQLSLGFRTATGVSLSLIQRFPGWDRALENLLAEGFIKLTSTAAIPTPRGYLVADGLALAFL